MIHSFGCGIAFSVGIVFGAAICRMATKQAYNRHHDDLQEHGSRVEDRLDGYVENTARMAIALELLAEREKGA